MRERIANLRLDRGLTYVELMIAMAILGVISILIYSATYQGWSLQMRSVVTGTNPVVVERALRVIVDGEPGAGVPGLRAAEAVVYGEGAGEEGGGEGETQTSGSALAFVASSQAVSYFFNQDDGRLYRSVLDWVYGNNFDQLEISYESPVSVLEGVFAFSAGPATGAEGGEGEEETGLIGLTITTGNPSDPNSMVILTTAVLPRNL